MAPLDSSTSRRRKPGGVFQILPSFVTSENDDEEALPVRRPKRNWPYLNMKLSAELLREILLLVAALIIIVWLFLGGSSKGAPPVAFYSGGPLIQTQQTIIVPSIPGGSDREGLKKAPGDLNKQEAEFLPQQDNPNAYLYVGSRTPSVVVVTVLDEIKYPRDYLNRIIENRIEYAQAHDYGLFIRMARDFRSVTEETSRGVTTWARVAIAREALYTFPKTKHFWFLDASALIMNPLADIEREFFEPARLEPKMLRNERVVRDQHYITSNRANSPKDVEFIMTRDAIGVTPVSFLYTNSLLPKAMFDTWLDPLYRWHSKFGDEADAWRHQVQWHSFYLNKVALVPPKLLASYADAPSGELTQELAYTDGDFTAVFKCDYATEQCKKDFQRFWSGRGRAKKSLKDAAAAAAAAAAANAKRPGNH